MGLIARAKVWSGIGGKVSDNKDAAAQQTLIADTKSAYNTTGSNIGTLRARQSTTQTEYSTSMGVARAKMAASGAGMDSDSWRAQQGQISGERDAQMSAIGEDRTALEASRGYGLVKSDYERMAAGGQSLAGESLYTSDQQSQIKQYDGGSEYMDARYGEYKEATTPTLAEYETMRFGSTAEQKAMSATMDTRIAAANASFEEASLLDAANKEYLARSGS